MGWSGKKSKETAELLREWLDLVLHNVVLFMSSEDIAAGTVWFSEIAKNLDESNVGIICLTKENLQSDWVLSEAGALSRHIGRRRLCVLLIDLDPVDVTPPLSEFQLCTIRKEDMYKLLYSLNQVLGDKSLSEPKLKKTFTTWWPEFEQKSTKIIKNAPANKAKSEKRSDRKILEELLGLSRQIVQSLIITKDNKDDVGPFMPKALHQILPNHGNLKEFIEKLNEFMDVTRGS